MPFFDAIASIGGDLLGSIGGSIAGGLATSAVGAITGTGGQAGTQAAQAMADPFASQRGQYQQQLSNMMQPGSQFNAQDPSYNFRFQQGEQAVNAGAASSGLLNSGARLSALQSYGQGMASQEYGSQFSRLSQLAGANVGSPAAAGQIGANANTQANANNSALGNQIGSSVGNLASSYFGNYTPQVDQQGTGGQGFVMNSGFGQ